MNIIKSYLTRRNLIIAGAIVVILGGWFYFGRGGEAQAETMVIARGEFLQQVSASGKVVPAQEVDLGFTQSGRITSVNARVGQTVGAGSVIATIDSGDIRANLQQREAALQTEQAKLDALKQGTRPEEIAVAQADVDSDIQVLAQAKLSVIEEIRDAFSQADNAVRVQVYQFVNNPRSAVPRLGFSTNDQAAAITTESKVVAAEEALTGWEAALDRLTADSDVQAAASNAQKNLNTVASLLSSASVALNRGYPDTNASQTEIDAYTADIASARTSINASISSITSAISALKNATSALDSSQKNLALKMAGTVQADINAQAARIRAAEADVANVRSQLSKTVIAAPFTGVITKIDLKTGAIASAGTAQVSMIGAGTFQIESFIPEVNIALIEVGDNATITLDAYGEEIEFGARVVSIDPADTIKDGVPTYRAVLQFSKADKRIKSGMTANIIITTETKENVIAVPRGLIIDRDGKKYVKIQSGEEIVEREVVLGSVSSLGQAEIVSGLEEGDVVVVKEAE